MFLLQLLLSMGWLVSGARAFATTHSFIKPPLRPRPLHASASATASESLPRIIPTKGVPIHLYTHDIEAEALDQLIRLAESPIPTDYVSAMPDVHWGQGVTIGSVFASETYVCPNAVGVDIGCGMVRTGKKNKILFGLFGLDKCFMLMVCILLASPL
jgi:tRNA-splicing ligase RtcB